eukprot:TRINITY_DN5984_c0_g1_i2.p1 TRINITY_DN5984_c0_g1~~TRINITY_DN5984_c0_g1_i2.p1  ORF type:complete len:567 (+),score=122.21 TRINITY_DN5984_c0_g1_i2:92-1792(+)
MSHLTCSGCKNPVPTSGLPLVPLPGDTSFKCVCQKCSTGNRVRVELFPKSWVHIVQTALFNLQQGNKNTDYFRWKEDICSFIDNNWALVCQGKARTATWHNTVASALSTTPHVFESGKDRFQQTGYWKLLSSQAPDASGPRRKRKADDSDMKKSRKHSKGQKARNSSGSSRKKRGDDDHDEPRKGTRRSERTSISKKPSQPPIRYYIPWKYYVPDLSNLEQKMCPANSAPQTILLPDNIVSNSKGYRMARSSFGAVEGTYFFEVQVAGDNGGQGHFRLGWSTEKGDLQAPVGYDRFSYSYRDIEGKKFHRARGANYGKAFGIGDTVGLLIKLTNKKFEVHDDPDKELEKVGLIELPMGENEKRYRLEGSEIRYYLNGEPQGVAATDIYEGVYYPAVSLYMGASVKVNFGAEAFKYPPTDIEFDACTALVPTKSPPQAPPVPPPGYWDMPDPAALAATTAATRAPPTVAPVSNITPGTINGTPSTIAPPAVTSFPTAPAPVVPTSGAQTTNPQDNVNMDVSASTPVTISAATPTPTSTLPQSTTGTTAAAGVAAAPAVPPVAARPVE